MELELDELNKLEAIFQQALVKIQSIPLWLMYVDHVRRRNDLSRDTTGQGRQTITQAYEFVLDQVGQDKDSGLLWEDYISFIKSGAGDLMGTGWQDRQKVDILRKAYQRAICVPMQSVTNTWKEYDAFEMGLNKTTVGELPVAHSLRLIISAGQEVSPGKVASLHDGSELIHGTSEHDARSEEGWHSQIAASTWL